MRIAACSLLVALTAFSFGCGARSDPGTPGTSPSSSATTIPNPATPLGLARPLSPLSTSTTATRTPTLRWALPSTADGALVELCADRACSQSIAKVAAHGDHLKLAAPIASSVVYWRVRATRDGAVGDRASATWELFTSSRDVRDTAWGTVPDFDEDGLGDWSVGAWAADAQSGTVQVFSGKSGGIANVPSITLHGDVGSELGYVFANIGDIDGDGFPELAVGGISSVSVFAGGPSSIVAPTASVFDDGRASAIGSAGDLDADGYGDFFTAPQNAPIVIHYGGSKGSTRTATIAPPIAAGFVFAHVTSGDLDGDGRSDLCTGWTASTDESSIQIFTNAGGLANPIALPAAKGYLAQVDCRGDVDGDGFADVVAAYVSYEHDTIDVFRGGPSGASMVPVTIHIPIAYGATASTKGPPIALGDFNGDGYDDLAAGLFGRELRLIPGSASGLDVSKIRSLSPPGGTSQAFVAAALAPNLANGGDVDGDGIVDLVAGAQGYWLLEPKQIADPGHVWVYLGSSTGLATAPAITLAGPGDDELTFGCDVE